MGYIGKVPADVLIDPHVDSAAITDGTIITADIADDAVTSAKLAQNSVDSSELIDGSVDNSHLAGSIAVNKTLLSAGTGLTLSTNTLNVDAAQSQITSVGTLSSLTVTGDANFDSNTLFVDSSESRVGVGLNNPAKLFHVEGSTSNDFLARIKNTHLTGEGLQIHNNNTNSLFRALDVRNSNGQIFQIYNDGAIVIKGDGSDQTTKWHTGSAYVNAKLDVRQLAIAFSGTDKVTSDTSGNFNFTGTVTATGSDYMIKSVSTSTTNGDAIRISAESGLAQGKIELDWFNDSSQTGGGYGMIQVGKTSNSPELRIGASAVRIGSQQGGHELKVNRSRMRHIDGVADANADFSHGDLYVNHISTGNIYMQRATYFASNLRMNAANSVSFQNASGNETVSLYNGGASNETVLYSSGGIELTGTTNSATSGKGRGQINASGHIGLNASTTWKTVRTLYGGYQSGILVFHVSDSGNAANTRCQIYAFNADYYERGVSSIDNVTAGVAPGGIEVQIVRDDGSTTSDGGGPYHVQARPANGTSALTVRLLILSAGD